MKGFNNHACSVIYGELKNPCNYQWYHWYRRMPRTLSRLSSDSFSSSRSWKSKRLSRVDVLAGDTQQNEREQTDFKKSWEDEFKTIIYSQQNSVLTTSLSIALISSVYDSIVDYTIAGLSLGDSEKIETTVLFHWVISFLCFLYCTAIALSFSLKYRWFKSFCVRNRTVMCSSCIVAIHLLLVYSQVIIEVRKILFPSDDHVNMTLQISKTMLPVRKCNDTEPWRTWLQPDQLFPLGSSGCSIALLAGGSYCTYLLVALLPLIVELQYLPAIAISAANSTILITAALAIDAGGSGTIISIFFQAAAGAAVAAGCHTRAASRRRQYALVRAMRDTSDRNRNLLYTLVPPNVVDHLDSLGLGSVSDGNRFGGGGELVGRDIPQCTVLFCTLERHAELQGAFSEEAFDLLSDIFTSFDDAVRRYGMYKYQHVGEW